jgi:hypothetical protein
MFAVGGMGHHSTIAGIENLLEKKTILKKTN